MCRLSPEHRKRLADQNRSSGRANTDTTYKTHIHKFEVWYLAAQHELALFIIALKQMLTLECIDTIALSAVVPDS